MLPAPIIRDWARKLVNSEAEADPTSAQTELATIRVYEKLRRQFCTPVGVDAFQSLVARALTLAKSQNPRLDAVNVTAAGGLRGLGETEIQLTPVEDVEVGIILIAQILRLFISLLGEATTIRLVEDASLTFASNRASDTPAPKISAKGKNYLGAFQDISLEADQLRHVSERLEQIADTHAGVDELMGVAGSIRNIATVLDVFTLLRSKVGGAPDSQLFPPTNGYMN